jgi:asparagine synthase (glutamine-hydrolysing)
MCGIAGIFGPPAASADELSGVVQRMAETLAHRGPDDEGVWVDEAAGIAFGHRRLAIIDLSQDGHQPMHSADERYVLSYNGEIYNFRELRVELTQAGYAFRSQSDTEVLLAATTVWGVHEACNRLNGMFAFALWDRREQTLSLARDRVGKKPLYYAESGGAFLFGSELKAIAAYPGFDRTVDRDVLAMYLRYNYVPASYCIYKKAHKLGPGEVLTVSLDGGVLNLRTGAFWTARGAVDRGMAQPLTDAVDAVDGLESLLRDAVATRMISDVPLGALLSGGVDSSTVVALMQELSDRPIKTFTIGYEESVYDESTRALAVADHLGTDHTELRVTAEEARAVIPRLPALYDEPFGDSSQIPTFLISQAARRDVTVALSGDGGDEVFGGYNRHLWADRVWGGVRRVPHWARVGMAGALMAPPPSLWDRMARATGRITPSALQVQDPGAKLQKLADAMRAESPAGLYRTWSSLWQEPGRIAVGGTEPSEAGFDGPFDEAMGVAGTMMYMDLVTYLPGDVLAKVDRASMGVSLEVRSPLLDHRVIEYAWRMPQSMKLKGGEGKWALRQVLDRHVPRTLVDGPKRGFGVPVGDWLRGPLREWAEGLISERRLADEGFLNPGPIRDAWEQHLGGRRNLQEPLWGVLMFQAWLESTR